MTSKHAGQPQLDPDAPAMITIAISLSPADAAELAAIGDGNRSAGVRWLLSRLHRYDVEPEYLAAVVPIDRAPGA